MLKCINDNKISKFIINLDRVNKNIITPNSKIVFDLKSEV